MLRAKLTSKGQVTIPADARRAAGLEPGDQVLFLVEGERITLIPVPKRRLTDLMGSLAGPQPVPVESSSEARHVAAMALGTSMQKELEDWCEPS